MEDKAVLPKSPRMLKARATKYSKIHFMNPTNPFTLLKAFSRGRGHLSTIFGFSVIVLIKIQYFWNLTRLASKIMTRSEGLNGIRAVGN
jgi:hypothetical protein